MLLKSVYLFFGLSCFFVATSLHAQPTDELKELQNQLRQIQSRLNAANTNNNDDPFRDRAPAVGRQRIVQRAPIDNDTMTIRFYDLSDLFSVAPQYPAMIAGELTRESYPMFSSDSASFRGGGGYGGGGGGVFNIPPAYQQQAKTMSLSAARVSVDGLIAAVQRTVAPEKWGDSEDEASINVLGNTLLISATDNMHEQIANLLDLFRKHWGKLKTVSVDAYWIRSTAKEVKDLLVGDEENRIVGKVDRKNWNTFFQQSDADNRIAYSASITGHNGQTLHTVSGRQKLVVLDAQPIHSYNGIRSETLEDDETEWENFEKSVSGLQPIRAAIQQGAALQVSPLATRGGNFVILDLHTRVNEMINEEVPEQPKVRALSPTGVPLETALDAGSYISYRLSSTIRCPKDEVILVGGMTYDKTLRLEKPNLYLFVRCRIHAIEPDETDQVDE